MNIKFLILACSAFFISQEVIAGKNKKNENNSFYNKYYRNVDRNIVDHLYKIYGKNPYSILALVDENNVINTMYMAPKSENVKDIKNPEHVQKPKNFFEAEYSGK